MLESGARRVASRYAVRVPAIGHGGMGVVWRAEDTLLGREVAIKEVRLPPSLAEDERARIRARVMREARAAARLNHPGAVTLHDIVEEDGRPFIVMELVRAPTLTELVAGDGPLPPARAAAIGLRLLDTLEAAHRAGIVHRDVKPGNVMVCGDGTTKLADFGIASLRGDPAVTASGLLVGSPAYMAPEQAEQGPVGPPTDLWALGATLYFAVEGEPPFEKGGPVPTLASVVHDPPRPMRRAGALEPALTALLRKSPGDRPHGADLRRLLRDAAAGPAARAAGPAVVSADTDTGTDTAAADVAVADPPATGVTAEFAPLPAPPEGAGERPARRGPRRLAALLSLVVVVLLGLLGWWAVATGRLLGPGPAAPAPAGTAPPAGQGWTPYAHEGGAFTVRHPPGWSVDPDAAERWVRFLDPAGAGRFFKVQVDEDRKDPLRAWEDTEKDFRADLRNHPGYRRVALERTAFELPGAEPARAALWEFTYDRNGRPTHAWDLSVVTASRRYSVLFQTDARVWESSRGLLDAFLQGFQPAA